MFGCGLPVCALTYSCIGELVSHEHNGLLFASPDQLAQQLLDCFRGFAQQGVEQQPVVVPGLAAAAAASATAVGGGSDGDGSASKRGSLSKRVARSGSGGGGGLLAQLRRGVAGSSMARWHDTWQKTVLPVLEGSSTTGVQEAHETLL
jgi:beta-1,4-mannosyltransferase